MGFDTDGDDAEDDKANDHGALDVVGDEGDAEAAEGGVNSCDGAFDDYCWETIETGQGVHNLLEG